MGYRLRVRDRLSADVASASADRVHAGKSSSLPNSPSTATAYETRGIARRNDETMPPPQKFLFYVMTNGILEVRSKRRLQRRVGQARQCRRLGRRSVRGQEVCANTSSQFFSGHFEEEASLPQGPQRLSKFSEVTKFLALANPP